MSTATNHMFCDAKLIWTPAKKPLAGKLWFFASLLWALVAMFPLGAQAQGNYVYVNNQAAANTVSAYSVSPAGALTQIAGSPFFTGGVGANVTCYGTTRITLSPANNLLFVANTGDRTITSFQINPATGGLTAVAGSPFPSGLTLDSCQSISLATTPDGKFLMASSNGQIQTFSIAANGALALLGTTANCCSPNASMVISPNGQFLAISNQTSVSMFTINAATGALTPVLGSPFQKTGTGILSGLDFSCAADRLYGGEATGSPALLDAWTIDTTTGILTPVPGTPFQSSGNDANNVLYSPDNTLLFQSNQFSNSLNTFMVAADGTLLNAGKFGATTQVHTPVGMATDATGNFLYVADDTFGVAVFRIGNGGVLMPLSDLAINRPGEIQDLVAYPARSCTSADLALSMTAAPNPVAPGAPIQYTISITNNGPSNATAVVADTLPPTMTSGGNAPVVNPRGANRSNSVSGNTVTGTVTITTTVPHQLFVGQTVSILSVPAPTTPNPAAPGTSFTDPGFTGVFTVTSVPGPTTFTYTQNLLASQFPETTAVPPQAVPAADSSGGGSASSAVCLVTTGPGSCSQVNFAPKPPIVPGTGANRSGNVVTITTTVPHQIFAGQNVTISGVANTTFNGTFAVVSVPSPTTFTYKQTAANAISGGGSATTPTTAAQLITFPNLVSGETRAAIINATAKSTLANGTIVSNTANISNKSTVDPVPGNNSATASVTIGTSSGTTITVPTATGPYGGSATLSATLTTTSGTPIAGKTIGFNFNQTNNVYSAVTNASGIATVVAPLDLTTVGTHPSAFTATFAGDASFGPSSATGTLIVTKAVLTVTADNLSRLYGDPNPPLTYTITGFVNGDTIAVVSGTANCSTTATQASPAGAYPITCTQGTLAATNYDFVFADGTLTVNPAPLTVTVNNATRAYGDPNPAFSGTITGLKNGDVITATYSTTATATSPAGTYPITATLVDPNNVLPNYTVTIANGTLTITQAALVVTANNAARLYGDPNPAFSGTIAGIKNGDNITAIYTTPATPASPVGTYPIIPSLSDNGTGALANYTVTVNNGSLTVSPAPLSVTADNATRAFGAPNPAFTGSIVGIKNADNITATYSTPATASSPAGTYPIIPALVDPAGKLGNYTVTINNGTLTVTSAVLTVTANSASRFYGDPNPLFTGTITGIQNGDNITATYTSAADPTSPVGTYPIVPVVSDNGTGALANYVVVLNNGVLTVNPAPLSVTVASFVRLYGDPNPAFSVTIVGIKNGDSITAALSTAADPTSAVGTYPIVATLIDPTNKLSNYSVTITNGALTINPAALSVTAANASRLFGTPNPQFSGIITGIKNGDPIGATYSTTAVASSPVGTYAITPALVDPAGKLGNYAVTSTDGTLTINAAPTANFVFVNNQAATGNSISGYSVAADGTLTGLAGSPVATGGLGANAACSSVNRMSLSAGSNLLFVSNGGDQTISAFQIDPTSGALTAAAGSPFASGLSLDACSGISLSATPDGRFLMAASNGQIATFGIGAGGVLSSLFTAANPVTPNASMKISANGQLVAVSNGTSVSVFSINPDGSLTPVAGSPFAEAGTGSLAGLDFNSTSGSLYGAEASTTAAFADAWTIGANGALSAVTGSPFSTAAINSNVVLLSPNDAFLFASNQGSSSVSSYSVAAGGSLSSLGSFGSATSLHAPAGMATDRSGSLLYVADDTFGVAVFRIDDAGSLVQLGDVAIAGAGQIQDLVAYPPRMASSADLSVTVSASSPNVVAGQNVTYTISVTNNGADPAAASVTDSLPSGFTLVSCSATGNGSCIGTTPAASFYLLQSGETQTMTIVAQTSLSIPNGTVTTNTVSISNSSAVDANAANNSASASVTVAQPAATTLAVAPVSATYGAANAVLSATLATSGGPLAGETVNFTLNGSPAGSGVTDANGLASVSVSLAGFNAGSYPVTASFAGDANNAAGSGSSTLTINPAALTVIADNATRAYGDPNPVFTGIITGIQNGDNITATYSTSAAQASSVGTYSIVPTLVDPAGKLTNYSVTTTNGTLTITQAPLSVVAANASMVYGDPLPALSGTITGIKNADNVTASYTTTATSASNVGTYPIVGSVTDNGTGVLANYAITVTDGTLTITPAPLTVTAANLSMVYGDPLPTLAGTITGIKNADNITATYSTAATSASAVGSYPITPTLVDPASKLSNYTVTSNNGTLTVTPAPLTVTAANATRQYGDPNPTFTGTITGIKNGDSITATYSSTATAASVPGTYAIIPALVDPAGKLSNYTVTVNNGTLTITPAVLTVTAANASMVFGDPVPALSGTITGIRNGENITASYSTAATSASPVGTYPIVAAVSDNGTGALANYTVVINNGVLTIAPAPLTVTAASTSRLYGDPNPGFTGTITGLKNGDSIGATFASPAVPTSAVGNYAIIPTLVDPNNQLGNYTVTSNNGVLIVNPAQLSVVADSNSRVYGDPNPAFTGTITGIKNGDNITATYSSVADPTSPVGTYPIVPALADPTSKLANYVVTSTNGSLTVSPAPLSIQANDATGTAGQPFPAFSGTIIGLKNADVITASYSTTADQTSPAGAYPIIPSPDPNPLLANYAVTLINGTLTLQ
ncbi:MAG TPA: MBG domain-containing protein [Candidatus Angelobacter sp.]|nr:MBG domain-containing protein [Candidatus Angelobacter sp.]